MIYRDVEFNRLDWSYTPAMRIFQGKLVFNKETDEKLRWITAVDGVPFKIYITQGRVPEPVPNTIEASVFDSAFSYLLERVGSKSVSQLSVGDKVELEKIGVTAAELRSAGTAAIFGAVWKPKEEHTRTVRYNAFRGSVKFEFGDPYIPKSLLGEPPYPERLLFLVRWIHEAIPEHE